MTIPSQCPQCGSISVDIAEVPPSEHEKGDSWYTRAECANCGNYSEWFE